jgi:hypothetical protein
VNDGLGPIAEWRLSGDLKRKRSLDEHDSSGKPLNPKATNVVWLKSRLPGFPEDMTAMETQRLCGRPQGVNVNALSSFRAVPKVPSWYTDAPVGENVNELNGSANISFK